MKSLRDLDSVGWIFFCVLFVLLMYPGYLLSCQMTLDDHMIIRIGFGLAITAMAAATISWAVNEVLQRRYMHREKKRRKAEKKKKRNSNRKKGKGK